MSGRSAHVRKQKGGAAAGMSRHNGHQPRSLPQEHHQLPSLYGYHPRPEPQDYPGQQYVPALNIIDFDFDASQVLTSKGARHRPQSSHGRSAGSVSSWSSLERSPTARPAPGESRIEKSAFRAFMDSKSDALRSKLSFKSPGVKPSPHSSHPQSMSSTLTPSPPATTKDVNALRFELPGADDLVLPSMRQGHGPAEIGLGGGAPPSPWEEAFRFGDTLSSVKRWCGEGKIPQPWSKLRKDPELWDPTGDTLIYLSHEAHGIVRPSPSLRVHSSVLEETGSVFLHAVLREGYIEHREYDPPTTPPLSTIQLSDSSGDVHAPSEHRTSDIILPLQQTKPSHTASGINPRSRQPTPPRSEFSAHDKEHPVLYELFFPAPLGASEVENLRHHLTTRNVFALLFNKMIVGLNLYQALLDLHERLQIYMPSESDNAGLIIEYIVSNRLDDIRNDPASAAGLLAWSEGPTVRWHEGWLEAFVHCSGMYARLKLAPEFRDVSHFTRVLLERASLEINVRVQRAADKLAAFDFADMWPMQSVLPPPERESFDRFRRFLIKYYDTVFWAWPPLPRFGAADTWLTRDVVQRLQRDFGALYDFLVDRDMAWDVPESPKDRNWKIVSKGLKPHFRVDSDGLPMTDILLGFDNRGNYPHIPHPFPLLPTSTPVQLPSKPSRFGKKPKSNETRFTDRRIALDYSEATNIFALGSEFGGNDLVEAFSQFEKTDQIGEVDPYHARRGRWILLYGILQILATVAVDVPNLRYPKDVRYFLNPRLQGTPPWRAASEPGPAEAAHSESYCWTTSKSWKDADHSMERSPLRNHREIVIKTAGIGDGTGRSPASDDDVTDTPPSLKDTQSGPRWVYSGDSPIDRVQTGPKPSYREEFPDWPIKSPETVRVRPVGLSGYIPPDEW